MTNKNQVCFRMTPLNTKRICRNLIWLATNGEARVLPDAAMLAEEAEEAEAA
jgi:hypothetical protein